MTIRVRLRSGVVVRTVEGGRETCAACRTPIRPSQRRTAQGPRDNRVARHAVIECQPPREDER